MHDSILKNTSICFDLDGTLVDTAPDLVRVLNLVIKQDGLKPVPLEDARKYIGYGALAMIKRAYDGAGIELDPIRASILHKQFLEIYESSMSKHSKPFCGVYEVLAKLKRCGADLSVCTNKWGYMARPLLQQLEMSQFFTRIVGAEDVKAKKPDPGHIYSAVGHRGQKPIIMIGDSGPDYFAARNAKIPCVLFSYGYSPVPVHSFGAVAVLRHFRDLPATLEMIVNDSKSKTALNY